MTNGVPQKPSEYPPVGDLLDVPVDTYDASGDGNHLSLNLQVAKADG